jgi:hypothetical protein
MYGVAILVTMAVLPVLSIVLEAKLGGHSDVVILVGKWFVFWVVGVRLFVAGLSQAMNPRYTAALLDLKEATSLITIQELGFANIAMGTLGLLALFNARWVIPGAVAGGLFLGLAGIRHVLNGERSGKENIAMVSDLAAAAVLAY